MKKRIESPQRFAVVEQLIECACIPACKDAECRKCARFTVLLRLSYSAYWAPVSIYVLPEKKVVELTVHCGCEHQGIGVSASYVDALEEGILDEVQKKAEEHAKKKKKGSPR